MVKQPKNTRLHALDGLRAIAILLVLFSHVNAGLISRNNFWQGVLFSNGILGVSFLFILSGFLMAYLYPSPPSAFAFLQKRYTRIFPLFLTVSLSIALLSFIPHAGIYIPLTLIIIGAFFVHMIWVYVIKKVNSPILSKSLFVFFLLMQLVSAVLYLWVTHHSSAYYYNVLSDTSRNLLIAIVNGTLTLPFGAYVPMLDPVYWSLAAEVLFYILYIFIAVPVINYLQPKSRLTKIVFLITLFPLFGGITIIFQNVFHFSLIRFQLFYFFIGGMTTAYLFRHRPHFVAAVGKLFTGKRGIVSLILFFALMVVDRYYFRMTSSIINQLWMSIFATFIFYLVLHPKTLLAKFLSSRVLVFLGMISYSMYLSHLTVFNLINKLYGEPKNVGFLVLYIAIEFAATIIVSGILYYLLERPYFLRANIKKISVTVAINFQKRAKIVLVSLCVIYLGTIAIVYQSDLNFFSVEHRYGREVIMSPKFDTKQTYISMQSVPVITLRLPIQNNNFGLVSFELNQENIGSRKFSAQQITFKIKEEHAKNWYSISQYQLTSRAMNLPEVYGFPTIHDSKGKVYDIQFSMDNPRASEFGLFGTQNNTIKSIYEINKKELFTNKTLLGEFVTNKIGKIVYNPEVQQVTLLFVPFFVIAIFLVAKKDRVLSVKKRKK